jgi:hypothetical protein
MSAAVAWVASHPSVTAPIVGARNTEQLRGSLDSVKIDMTPELRASIPGDFGRAKAVAWYGILEFDVIWDTDNAGEAKMVTSDEQPYDDHDEPLKSGLT